MWERRKEGKEERRKEKEKEGKGKGPPSGFKLTKGVLLVFLAAAG